MEKKIADCVFVPRDLIDETLRQAPYQGKHLLEPFKGFAAASGLPFNILEDHKIEKWGNDTEVHRHEIDLWIGLEGRVTFIYGGRMDGRKWAKKLPDESIDDRELKAERIAGGEEKTVEREDWVFIPAGQPHAHYGSGRVMIIKIPAKDLVSLEDIPGWEG